MSNAFRELLKKVGSGTHTSKALTRQEAATAMGMMLTQEATPAQIGAFLIAHRIRRPTGEELAGMLDAFDQYGPQVPAIQSEKPVVILSQPYDGRDRTLPLGPLTSLVLAAAGIPVLQHGGDVMPTKAGVPLIDIWQGLGIHWRSLSLGQIQEILQNTDIGFVYLPEHFPLAHGLVPYREQIGKRPPLATVELIWCPYSGPAHIVAGFVHPPTELMMREALNLRGITEFTTVKGLEGSCDLPRERTGIIGLNRSLEGSESFSRLRLHAQDYGFAGKNPPWQGLSPGLREIKAVLAGEPGELHQALVWNSGFYLWQFYPMQTLEEGIQLTQELLEKGIVQEKLNQLQKMTHCRSISA
ncbi:anthranilate phosphoribosyltransferase family protein [Candidatus Synechococcus calcipolaris G9]|uniref:Anthranilate phosphoribosyltransferase family protein n=1 Tax=Candidatus Synechococcus calcipolaris G9 TaxID=1497997 RepID=A0ABT6EW43_9SYNE|nr:anthranilate phosphoribosyltransferase family protein [Candidatus Synechococcus calcipolaris]MDG2989602.1 anthranilate phosphoribosyltransferase family protein [Candidatus Synechococcus calcipolaris G9]